MQKITRNEIWKDIPQFEGYQASNLGRIKSFKTKTPKIKKPTIATNGYKYVGLMRDSKFYYKTVHQLVAMAFLKHTPCGYKRIVDHINNIPTDNRLDNLQIITPR